jgi:hypothetical protein
MALNSKFDKDLKFGEAGENWLVWLGSPNVKVEVKTERDQWANTGNVVFEYRCRGRDSGVTATRSDVWVHLLWKDGGVVGGFIWSVPHLKAFLREVIAKPGEFGARLVSGGDDKVSEMIVVPLSQLHKIPRVSLPL